MAELRFENEKELIEEIQKSKAYIEFSEVQLEHKIAREKAAWKILEENRGKYTKAVLDKVFDTVDLFKGNKRWFGSMLATPNRNLIFESDMEEIRKWLNELLFSGQNNKEVVDNCLKKRKIKGASKGLVTLLLYLSSPEDNNIWVHTTENGLSILGRVNELRGNEWGENYSKFNNAAIKFRDDYKLKPNEIDWMLSYIGKNVETDNGYFRMSEDYTEPIRQDRV
jgi:hypothetical protein